MEGSREELDEPLDVGCGGGISFVFASFFGVGSVGDDLLTVLPCVCLPGGGAFMVKFPPRPPRLKVLPDSDCLLNAS